MKIKPSQPHLLPVLGLLAVVAVPAGAQLQGSGAGTGDTAASTSALRFVPRIAVAETATSNVNLSTNGQSDFITRVSPSLYASSRSGRVQGFVDYTLNGLLYARGTRTSQFFNVLRADGRAEVLEKQGFIDASASISQQAINPLGVQSTDPQVGRTNQVEVRTLQLAPRLEGRLGAGVEWTAQASHSQSTSTSATTSNSTASTAAFDIGNGSQPTQFGWSLRASRTQRSFSLGRTTDNDILRGVLDYRFSPEFSAGAIGGYESTNVTSTDKEGRATYGLRLGWTPSPRAQLRAELEKRYFGSAHSLNFSYRWPLAALSFTDTRSVANGVNQPVQQRDDQAALYRLVGLTPGTAGVEQELQERLRARGISFDPNAPPVVTPFLSSGVTLVRSQQLALTWLGLRDSLTFAAQQSSSERLDNFPAASDAFSLNGAIRQRGYSLTLAHRLTPQSKLSVSVTQTRTNNSNSVSTGLRSATAEWSTLLGPRTTFSLLGRRTRFTSSTQPYDESALIGTFGMIF